MNRKAQSEEPSHSASLKRRKARTYLALAILLFLAIAIGAWLTGHAKTGESLSTNANRPNVLLVTLDTTRADFLGCYGRSKARTPNIDALAQSGVVFSNCSTAVPLTLPSHATIMTGLFPFSHGVRRNGVDRLPDDNVTIAEALSEQGYATAAVVASFVLDRQFGLAQGFDTYVDIPDATGETAYESERHAREVADITINNLHKLSGSPFFMWTHFYDPHHPYLATRPNVSSDIEAYDDEIASVDQHLGRILNELNLMGIRDNTMIVVVADHGEGLDDHAEPGHGFFLYQTTAHVPFIIDWPEKLTTAKRLEQQVRTADIAPTILDLLDLPQLNDVQGVSLVPLIAGEDQPHLPAYCEAIEGNALFDFAILRSIAHDGWKYIHGPSPELYNTADDPNETANIIETQPELAAELAAELQSFVINYTAQAPPSTEHVDLTPRELERLASLGYTGKTKAANDNHLPELQRFNPNGEAPNANRDTLRMFGLALRANAQHLYPQMENYLRQVTARHPNCPYLVAELAGAIAKQGRVDEAMQIYEQALALQPEDDSPIRAEYCVLLMKTLRWEEAIVQAAPVVAHNPNNISGRHNLGLSLAAIGRFDEAQWQFEQALKIDSQSVRVLHARGCAYVWEGRLPEAAECLKKGLELAPSNILIKRHLDTVLERMQ